MEIPRLVVTLLQRYEICPVNFIKRSSTKETSQIANRRGALVNRYLKFLFVLAFILPAASVFASIEDDAIQRADRARDIRALETKPKGTWLPVPIPVSNPTIGTGLQAAVLYLHPKSSPDSTASNATSGIMGLLTDTESWFVSGFHDGNWNDDQYRFRIIGGTGEFELDFFGTGQNPIFADNPLSYNLRGDIFIGHLLRLFPRSRNWYFGLRYMHTDQEVAFDVGNLFPGLPPHSTSMTTSGLGLMTTFDSRDDNYYPTGGCYSEVVWTRDDDALGSDYDFDKLTFFYNYFIPITAKDTLALRAALADTAGNTPFFLLPNLKMRGFPSGLYKDESSLSGHLEWRRKFLPRWGLILFSEAGSVSDSMDEIFDAEIITSYGGGVRWQVSGDKALNLGVDVGFSGDDYEIYVQIGERY